MKEKKIRVPREVIDASWGTLLNDLSIQLIDSSSETSGEVNDFQITEALIPDKLLLENKNISNLFKNYFSTAENFDLVSSVCSKNKEVFSIKIHDYLNLGHFIDAIVVEAYKNNYSCDKIRLFLNSILNHSFQLIQAAKSFNPLEITFGSSDDGFALQISVPIKSIAMEKEWYLISNFVDVTEYQKTSSVNISALWFKEDALKNLHCYFYKKQVPHKNLNQSNLEVSPVLNAESVPYDPEYLDASKKMKREKQEDNDNILHISGSKNQAETVNRISGSKEEQDDGTFVHGTREDLYSGNMRVGAPKSYEEMEMQLRRMQKLILKMKGKIKAQENENSAGTGDGSIDQELLAQVARLESKSTKLEEEKRAINARLQLANRKLLIMDNNLHAREQLVVNSLDQVQTQAAEVEVIKQAAEVDSKAANNSFNELMARDTEIKKLNDIKVIYENKIKDQAVEIKKMDAKLKSQSAQLESLKKMSGTSPTVVRHNETHIKQLEVASNKVSEMTKELNDKKKELILAKQENSKLIAKIAELEKKIQFFIKKAA